MFQERGRNKNTILDSSVVFFFFMSEHRGKSITQQIRETRIGKPQPFWHTHRVAITRTAAKTKNFCDRKIAHLLPRNRSQVAPRPGHGRSVSRRDAPQVVFLGEG